MDYLYQIQLIKNRFIENNYLDYSNEITEELISSGVGGEVLIRVCSKLLEIERKDKMAYLKVKDLAFELIKYAKLIGLYPH